MKQMLDPLTAAQKRRHRFVDGKLYRILKENKSQGMIWLYDYKAEKNVAMLLSDFRRYSQLAFTKREAATLIGVGHRTLARHMTAHQGDPLRMVPCSSGQSGMRIRAYYSEDMLFKIRDYFAHKRSRGRPRKDGYLPSWLGLLTEEELAAKLERRLNLYIKTADGNFVPIWQAEI